MQGLGAKVRARARDEDEQDGSGKRYKATDRPVTKALEKKKSKVSKALELVKDRYGASERFEMEQAYRDSMDHERDSGRITSFGRKNPSFPQGAIVRSVKQHTDAYQQRHESVPEFKRVVPLGSKLALDIMPGEVLIQRFAWRVPNPKVKQGDTSLVVTSHVGGFGAREKAQFAGIATTANRVSTADGDNRSTSLVAGHATTIHTGHQVIPAFSTVIATLTPYAVRGDSPGSMVPAIDEKGQPDDKFRVALHPLDERVVSAVLLRRRKMVDNLFVEFKGPLGTEQGMASTYWPKLSQLVADELKGFELFPDDRPTAPYIAWYGIRRALFFAAWKNYGFVGCGAAAFITEMREKFKISREDEDFVASHGGTIDMSEEGKVLNVLKDASLSAADAYLQSGIDRLVENKIDHAVQGLHCVMRRMVVGIALNWCNPGSELDVLVGMGGY